MEATIDHVVPTDASRPPHPDEEEEQAQPPEVKVELSPEQEARYQLITRDLEEIVGSGDIRTILKEGRDPCIYWGTATTGKPHLGYFVPIYKISDFLAGLSLKSFLHFSFIFIIQIPP